MSEELERMRAERDEARNEMGHMQSERTRFEIALCDRAGAPRGSNLFGVILRILAERDAARTEVASLKAQLDPEGVKHWDAMRAERDAARAALREIGEKFDLPRPSLTTDGFMVLLTRDEDRGIHVTNATAAAMRAARGDTP